MISTPTEQTAKPIVDGINRLAALMRLPADWDSYGGIAPSNVSVVETLALLLDLWSEGVISADLLFDIVPVPTGVAQVEWSGPRGDIEIEIDRFGTMRSLLAPVSGPLVETPADHALTLAEVRNQVRRIVA